MQEFKCVLLFISVRSVSRYIHLEIPIRKPDVIYPNEFWGLNQMGSAESLKRFGQVCSVQTCGLPLQRVGIAGEPKKNPLSLGARHFWGLGFRDLIMVLGAICTEIVFFFCGLNSQTRKSLIDFA